MVRACGFYDHQKRTLLYEDIWPTIGPVTHQYSLASDEARIIDPNEKCVHDDDIRSTSWRDYLAIDKRPLHISAGSRNLFLVHPHIPGSVEDVILLIAELAIRDLLSKV